MLTCALIQDNIIVDIKTLDDGGIQSASLLNQAVIDITNIYPQPQIGWTFNGSGFVSNGQNYLITTKLALKNRFTDSENIAILTYMDNTSAPYRYPVKMLMDKLNVATFVDLARVDTISGINLLVYAGLLTSDRASTILTTPPTSSEIYKGQ